MSNKVYMLQVSDDEDPKLLSKIITTLTKGHPCWTLHVFGNMYD